MPGRGTDWPCGEPPGCDGVGRGSFICASSAVVGAEVTKRRGRFYPVGQRVNSEIHPAADADSARKMNAKTPRSEEKSQPRMNTDEHGFRRAIPFTPVIRVHRCPIRGFSFCLGVLAFTPLHGEIASCGPSAMASEELKPTV